MYYNSIIILIGIIVIVIALYILLYTHKRNDLYNEKFNPIVRKSEIEHFTTVLKKDILDLKYELKGIDNELNLLKESVDLNNQLISNLLQNKDNLLEKKTEKNEMGSFASSLNYNKFLQKNKDIIELYQTNKGMEDIAKELNRSIREVEMVLKLVK